MYGVYSDVRLPLGRKEFVNAQALPFVRPHFIS